MLKSSLPAILLILVVLGGCRTSPTEPQNLTLLQSIQGNWKVVKTAVSTPDVGGGHAVFDTLRYDATVAALGDTAFSVTTDYLYGKVWHDSYRYHYFPLKEDSTFQWGTVRGRIHSSKLISYSGQYSGGGTRMNTTFTATLTRD